MSECKCGCGCPEKNGYIINGKCTDCFYSRHHDQKTQGGTGVRYGFKPRENFS